MKKKLSSLAIVEITKWKLVVLLCHEGFCAFERLCEIFIEK